MIGKTLAHYQITAELGKGGMGEVWRARDTKLGRDVAIKMLPEDFAADDQRLARFEREAQLLASLNHPNIGAIYGIEENALVLELIEGDTLADCIARGPIPLDEALSIARQIAEALETAHDAGIIHRDLKPANIKVKDDGTVKVLDFGLAKAIEGKQEGSTSESPTMTAAATQAGIILGTAAYMAPEQARGKVVDRRADVWAFGVVVYEMLTGKMAFEAEDVSLTLAEVMKSEPDWDTLPADVSPVLRTYLRRCLEKDPKQRVRDIGDVRLAIDGAFETATETAPPPDSSPGARVRPMLVIGLAGLVIGAILAGVTVRNRTSPLEHSVNRFSLMIGSPLRNVGGPPLLAISPDGRTTVYASPDRLYRRDLENLEARPIPNTDGGTTPFFSPDGRWLGFVDGSNHIKKVSLAGGPAVTLAEASVRGASWGPDETIAYGVFNAGLSRVSAAGGESQVLTTLADGETGHYRPHFLPGGRALLFTVWSGKLETAQIAVLSLDSGEYRTLVGGTYPRYSPSGHIVFARKGSLWVVPFDADALEVTGTPVPVIEDVQVDIAFGSAEFDLAGDGTLLYATGGTTGNTRTLVWVDREGREEPLSAERRPYMYPRISPDGTRIALSVGGGSDNDIWVWDIARQTLTRFTFDPAVDQYPVWTPDGTHVAFASSRAGGLNLFWKPADGTGTVQRLDNHENFQLPYTFSPDGKRLVFGEQSNRGGQTDLAILTLEGGTEALTATAFHERNAEISPDGRWIAYQSNESGQDEIFVRPFPDVDKGRWQVSRNGGTQPLWAPDGSELFYVSVESRPGGYSRGILAVPIETESGFTAGNPTVAYGGDIWHPLASGPGRNYDISPDGERFLIIRPVASDRESPSELVLVQNWFEELKRLAPAEN